MEDCDHDVLRTVICARAFQLLTAVFVTPVAGSRWLSSRAIMVA